MGNKSLRHAIIRQHVIVQVPYRWTGTHTDVHGVSLMLMTVMLLCPAEMGCRTIATYE